MQEITLNQVKPEMEIQLNYLTAWFDFIDQSSSPSGTVSLKHARDIAKKHKDCPVKHWNELFAAVLDLDDDRALADARVKLRRFPPNTIELCQPADQWPIQKIKEIWMRAWEAKKLEMLKKEQVSDASGKLSNPGKIFFLKLVAESIREANKLTDANGMNYARKAMIRCGLSLEKGVWSEEMLSKPLQAIIDKYRENFEGIPVHDVEESDVEEDDDE
ncbi:hypothetical protein HDU98_008361 [Podochytrium sp. JEL0797]|nr:hypothetical protein HDU98_008361 [Podochytrium sp. JEL0797]